MQINKFFFQIAIFSFVANALPAAAQTIANR